MSAISLSQIQAFLLLISTELFDSLWTPFYTYWRLWTTAAQYSVSLLPQAFISLSTQIKIQSLPNMFFSLSFDACREVWVEHFVYGRISVDFSEIYRYIKGVEPRNGDGVWACNHSMYKLLMKQNLLFCPLCITNTAVVKVWGWRRPWVTGAGLACVGGGGGFTQTCRAGLRAAASPALVGQQYSWSLSRSLKYTDS